jgi:D-alanyl-D-alanine dipeptidase
VPELVDAQTRIPDLVVDLRYATPDNFLHRAVYPATARCLLLPETLDRLVAVADSLRPQGLRLRVYDCYRPRSVQWEMWKLYPKPGYVADPRQGSHHNRGAAVDLTLADAEGKSLEMPTAFDAFERAAHHGYAGGSARSRENRERLRTAMEAAGFQENRMEWWHYQLPHPGRFPVLDLPFDTWAR